VSTAYLGRCFGIYFTPLAILRRLAKPYKANTALLYADPPLPAKTKGDKT
jgi:hypothetical protein